MDRFAFDDLYVRRLKEHDRETEDHFHKYFSSLLFVTLRKRLSDAQAIEDVTQETLVRALEHIDGLRENPKLGAFVMGISHHVLQEWYRTESRAVPLEEKHNVIPGPANVEAEFVRQELKEHVRDILNLMPAHEAAILRAVFIDEKDKDEVCREFGVDREYLRVLLHRAKKRFKSLFL
jgi:RNA polymerase sigma-70 factor (ECF subfamily)